MKTQFIPNLVISIVVLVTPLYCSAKKIERPSTLSQLDTRAHRLYIQQQHLRNLCAINQRGLARLSANKKTQLTPRQLIENARLVRQNCELTRLMNENILEFNMVTSVLGVLTTKNKQPHHPSKHRSR